MELESIAETHSLAESVSLLPEPQRTRVLQGLSDAEISPYNWAFWGRPKQFMPPLPWRVWLVMAGRGFGKTRCGSESVRVVARQGTAGRIAIVGDTAGEVREVMVEGPDGILPRSPRGERPKYEPSKRRLTWPNGVIGTTYGADDPEILRGPQHGFAWVDELAKFRYAQEAWDNLMLGLRMGESPRAVVTTTPRPVTLIRKLLKRAGQDVIVTRGTTYENARNLAPEFMADLLSKYEGTTLGRQELHAEMLDEAPGAIWTRELVESLRVRRDQVPELRRIVVAVDPSVSEDGEGAECGIVVFGIDGQSRAHGYVLEDATVRGGPVLWARKAVDCYRRWAANLVIAEGNQGGALVKQVLRGVEAGLPVQIVYASRGKVARAEPVSVLYEQGRVHHAGTFAALEDEMVNWLPGMPSPNRIDALVWAASSLMVRGGGEVGGEVF